MIDQKRRDELFADRFAFGIDEEVLVNGIDLTNELIAFDKLKAEFKILQKNLELKEMLLELKQKSVKYRRYDVRA